MKVIVPVAIGVGLIALVACDATRQSSGFSDLASLDAKPVHARTLDRGDYLVTVVRHDECNAGLLDVAKSYRYDDEMVLSEVALRSGGLVPDNVIRAAVCIPGLQEGAIALSLAARTSIKTDGEDDGLSIAKVERILKTQELSVTAPMTLPAGRYVVTLEGEDDCNGHAEIAVSRFHEVSWEASAPDAMILGNAGRIFDNLMRPAVCVAGPVTGEVYLELSKTTALAPKDELTVKAVRKLSGVGPAL